MGSKWRPETRFQYKAIARLRKSGLSKRALKEAIAAIRGAAESASKVVWMTRKETDCLNEVLRQHGKAVVVNGRNGKNKVYSWKGYTSAVESTKAWHASKKPKAEAAPKRQYRKRRKARKQYVHWTQRPENAEKRKRVVENLLRRASAKRLSVREADGVHEQG